MTNQVLKRAQCKALIHGSIFPGKNQYISPFSNFSWSKGGSNSQSLDRQSSVLPLSRIPSLLGCVSDVASFITIVQQLQENRGYDFLPDILPTHVYHISTMCKLSLFSLCNLNLKHKPFLKVKTINIIFVWHNLSGLCKV